MEMEQQTTCIDLTETKENGVDVGAAGTVPLVSEERRLEITNEMSKLEDEINTLKQALIRKERQLNDLRAELGITRWTRIQNSEAVNKSKQVLADTAVKTSQAIKDLSTATANKWTEIRYLKNEIIFHLRDSPRMQTVSEKFWSTTESVKAKIVGGTSTSKTIAAEPPTAQIVVTPETPMQ